MIYVLTSFLILIIVGYFIWRKGSKPYKHKSIPQNDLKRFFEVLLYRGYDRGFLCIEVPQQDKFLQFSKYINGKKSVGIQFDFPLTEWSREYYELLRKVLIEKGIDFDIQKTEHEGVSEFLVVDLKQDLALALNLTKLILQSIYRLDENQSVDLYFENVSPKDERIGF